MLEIFLRVLIVEVFQDGTQLVRIRVFAIDNHYRLFATFYIFIDAAFDIAADIGDLAELTEIVVVPLVQQHSKFLVIVEDIAFILRYPVYIYLMGVIGAVGVIEGRCLSGSFLLQAGWA